MGNIYPNLWNNPLYFCFIWLYWELYCLENSGQKWSKASQTWYIYPRKKKSRNLLHKKNCFELFTDLLSTFLITFQYLLCKMNILEIFNMVDLKKYSSCISKYRNSDRFKLLFGNVRAMHPQRNGQHRKFLSTFVSGGKPGVGVLSCLVLGLKTPARSPYVMYSNTIHGLLSESRSTTPISESIFSWRKVDIISTSRMKSSSASRDTESLRTFTATICIVSPWRNSPGK